MAAGDDIPKTPTAALHPATTVTNIRNDIPITLDAEEGNYNSWMTLFKIHCTACKVLDHIIVPETATSNPDDEWLRLDAIVLKWIYGTISPNLLTTILQPKTTAAKAWTSLAQLFVDNKPTRAVMLQQKLYNTRLADFPNVSAYCQELKHLSDQLSNVDAPVSDQSLVIQLIAGLNMDYDNVATNLQQSTTLPTFEVARSRLVLEEGRKARLSASANLTAVTQPPPAANTTQPTPAANTRAAQAAGEQFLNRNLGRGFEYRGRGRGGRRGGRGGRRGGGRGSHNYGYGYPSHSPWVQQPWAYPNQTQWAVPPCPYPTAPMHRPPPRQPGILGQAPSASFAAADYSYTPTNIDYAFQTMSLNPDQNWYMDTGATNHMANNSGILPTYFNNGFKHIVVGNGSQIPTTGIGQTTLKPPFPPLQLPNVLVSPSLIKNLISVRRLTRENNVSVEFDPYGFLVKDFTTKLPLFRSNSSGDLYPLSLPAKCSPATFAVFNQDVWHHRLGHPDSSLLRVLHNNSSISLSNSNKQNLCQSCVFGKHIKLPFHDSLSVTYAPFDIIHSDLWTSPVPSTGGHRYYILFLDDFTNYLWTYPLINKSSVYSIFLQFNSLIKTQFEKSIKTIQCDNGTEYNNQQFHNFCQQFGMQFRFSCPHTSSQNGKAERKIRSINNIIRTLLTHASLPPSFWHHALDMATYILNILPSKLKSFYTPTHLLYHKSPTYTHLRTFGCLCYPLLPSTTINKLQQRSTPCVFLGYPSNHRGYKCYDLSTKKIRISRHVLFDESTFPFQNTPFPRSYDFLHKATNCDVHPNILHHPYPPPTTPPIPVTTDTPPSDPVTPARYGQTYSRQRTRSLNPDPTNTTEPSPPTSASQPVTPGQHTAADSQPNPTPTQSPPPPNPGHPMQTRSKTGHARPKPTFNLNTETTLAPVPKNLTEALNSPIWNHAMTDEFKALIENKTWELVPRTHGMNIIRCMWIFKQKLKSDGTLERYKARLVGDGRTQQVGVDCSDTFSPVVKPATIRVVLTLALNRHWDISQLDVKNAFLHGNLSETVFMHQPPGFRDANFPDHVCRLRKSLYGLKQAPRAWYQRFTDYVTRLGFKHSSSDHSLFIYRRGADVAYILLYVDDIIMVTSSSQLKTHFMSHLSAEFAMKDLGPLSYFLGVAVKKTPDGLFLSQNRYALDILQRAKMKDCNPVTTPVDTAGKLGATAGVPFDDPTLYRSLAGALQYLTFTRPDISYAVQQVCMHMHAPYTDHYLALKRILRYIKGTLDMGLWMRPSSLSTLVAFTDADWAGCPDTRRSTSGYCVFLGDNLLSWSSKRQSVVSRSSAEAEYRGVANVVSEICWIRNLLLELGCPLRRASLVYTDNVSAIYLSGNPVQHQRTKHIEIDIHFVREKVQRGQIRVLHVPSRHNFSDIFTKGLPRVLFLDFRSSLSLRDPPP